MGKTIIFIVMFFVLYLIFEWISERREAESERRRLMYEMCQRIYEMWRFTFGITEAPTHEDEEKMRQACRRILLNRTDDIQCTSQKPPKESK